MNRMKHIRMIHLVGLIVHVHLCRVQISKLQKKCRILIYTVASCVSSEHDV